MNRYQFFRWIGPAILLALACGTLSATDKIVLNEEEYFEGPGFSFLLFHNNYQVGFQGGLQMIQNGERVLDSGDLLLVPKGEEERPEQRVLRREVDREHSTATVYGEIEGWNSGYQLICRTDGERILITLKLDRPIDWSKVERAGFRISLYPGTYYSTSFQGDSGSGVFPRQYDDKAVLTGPTKILRVAQEDPLHSFIMSRSDGPLFLVDPRQSYLDSWFMVIAPLEPGSEQQEVQVEITPSLRPEWRRPPVIGISQVGYHPAQTKRAVLELDARDEAREPVKLYQLTPSGDEKLVKSEPARPWGKFLRFKYATFDFSEARDPGVYLIEFRDQRAGPFRIAEDVYDGVWQPTLEYFLPVQMCHVAVREDTRTWHGACHLDDAMQAPAGKQYIDGYQQGERETKFADNEHVPGLNWGGWHDAGDNDLPAGSIAMTTLPLTLAQEEFKASIDQTSIQRPEREVLLHVSDGHPDLLQQIEYGVQSLLALTDVSGHVFPGIISSTHWGYNHVGDPVNVTDNRVYDPKLKPGEVRGDFSGKPDDRWVFTNRNTGLQYEVAQALAAASRVLRDYRPDLADQSLAEAKKLWEYEQANAPVYPANSYVPRDSGYRRQEIEATAELLITTGEAKYRQRLLALLPEIRSITGEQFGEGPGWVLARAIPKVGSEEFESAVLNGAKQWRQIAERRAATNPYGVRYPDEVSNPGWKLEGRTHVHSGFVWGHGWILQAEAMRQYYLHQQWPNLFDRESLLAVVNFVLGCHPANNQSFVSGVGAFSPIIAYGYNRHDWSHIPGGVISGTSLVKPDYMELKIFPFLWYQTEYVISGAATYIFDVLAAQSLLNK
jgi:endoglucanase